MLEAPVGGARDSRRFREFAAEPFTRSTRTQYQSCRAFNGLSIGIHFITTQLETVSLFVLGIRVPLNYL